jgi:hypothetical protein
MAITTYSELKIAVVAWLDIATADLTSVIDDLVTVGEKRIFRECRTRDMEDSFSTAISSGTIALPSNYVELKYARIDGTPSQPLERRSAESLYEMYPNRSSEGKPKYIAREGATFIFGPYADSAYTVKGIFYKRLTVVASAANALFVANPDLYLFACLAESEIVIGRDSRIPIWEAKYNKILADVNGEDRREQASGSTLRMR